MGKLGTATHTEGYRTRAFTRESAGGLPPRGASAAKPTGSRALGVGAAGHTHVAGRNRVYVMPQAQYALTAGTFKPAVAACLMSHDPTRTCPKAPQGAVDRRPANRGLPKGRSAPAVVLWVITKGDGNLYGTTFYGGAHLYYGTVFKLTPSGTLTTLYSFCEDLPLRDTLAVGLLQASVLMERISVLLGHNSIRVTEWYYSLWVRPRQEHWRLTLGAVGAPNSRRTSQEKRVVKADTLRPNRRAIWIIGHDPRTRSSSPFIPAMPTQGTAHHTARERTRS